MFCLAAAPTALAQTLPTSSISVLAGTCLNCHGPTGQAPRAIPALAGQSAAHLTERLRAFKAGSDANATVMTRLMKGYDAPQIEALAQWFAEVKP